MKLFSISMRSGQGVKDRDRQGNQLSAARYFRSFPLITFGEREVATKWVLIVVGQLGASFSGPSHMSLLLHIPIKWEHEGSAASWGPY